MIGIAGFIFETFPGKAAQTHNEARNSYDGWRTAADTWIERIQQAKNRLEIPVYKQSPDDNDANWVIKVSSWRIKLFQFFVRIERKAKMSTPNVHMHSIF